MSVASLSLQHQSDTRQWQIHRSSVMEGLVDECSLSELTSLILASDRYTGPVSWSVLYMSVACLSSACRWTVRQCSSHKTDVMRWHRPVLTINWTGYRRWIRLSVTSFSSELQQSSRHEVNSQTIAVAASSVWWLTGPLYGVLLASDIVHLLDSVKTVASDGTQSDRLTQHVWWLSADCGRVVINVVKSLKLECFTVFSDIILPSVCMTDITAVTVHVVMFNGVHIITEWAGE